MESGDFIVTTKMIDEALKLTINNKALGPDGVSNLHLKRTGPIAREYLAGLATLSFSLVAAGYHQYGSKPS